MELTYTPDIVLEVGKPMRIAIFAPFDTLSLIYTEGDFPKEPQADLLYDENPAPIKLVHEIYTHFFGEIFVEDLRQLFCHAVYTGSRGKRGDIAPNFNEGVEVPDDEDEPVEWYGYHIVFDYLIPPEDLNNPEVIFLRAYTYTPGKITVSPKYDRKEEINRHVAFMEGRLGNRIVTYDSNGKQVGERRTDGGV